MKQFWHTIRFAFMCKDMHHIRATRDDTDGWAMCTRFRLHGEIHEDSETGWKWDNDGWSAKSKPTS